MKNSAKLICLLVFGIAFTWKPLVFAQQPAAPKPLGDSIKATTNEVVLDGVVRDKKGRAVNNLKAEDFHITDNGDAETIKSFRLVTGSDAIATGGARTKLDPLRQIRLVTLIFHCYNNDARRLAHDAAIDLLKNEFPQNVYMSVMTIDHRIEVLQAFT